MTDVAKIAKGLSKAQQKTMLWPRRVESLPIMVWAYPSTMQVLERLGLLGERHGGWFELSPLGLRVRELLENEAPPPPPEKA